MGKATRWFKSLFVTTQSKENHEEMEYSVQPKDRIRWSSGPLEQNGSVSCLNPPTTVSITPAEAAWLTSFYNEPDNEQKQHARAVAAATAAAADAAIAAAQAAATVLRLTSQGRSAASFGRAKFAASRIQTAFRGYLARKALRALKGLVKIQALVRGFLVRKQAAATLRRMQALVRAQESFRAQKARRCIDQARKSSEDHKKEHRALSLGSKMVSSSSAAAAAAAINNALEENARIVEVDTGCWPKSRPKRAVTWILDLGDESSVKAVISSPARERGLTFDEDDEDECHFSTPPEGVCAERDPFLRKESFKAKQRSRSAPKQRPGPNRSLSLLESRNSLRMTTTYSRVQEAMNFKNAVIGKIGRSPNFVKD